LDRLAVSFPGLLFLITTTRSIVHGFEAQYNYKMPCLAARSRRLCAGHGFDSIAAISDPKSNDRTDPKQRDTSNQ
jgi:hypothetical protein